MCAVCGTRPAVADILSGDVYLPACAVDVALYARIGADGTDHGIVISDIRPLLPAHPVHTRGGRPIVDDFRCFCGIVYPLRNAIRWNDMLAEYPSGMTCRRRFDAWSRVGV